MHAILRNALLLAGLALLTPAFAQVTFYEREGFRGDAFTTDRQIRNFGRYGFNDRASSVVVTHGRWEVCEEPRFSGRCAILRPGRYASLAAIGLNDRVTSARSVTRDAHTEEYGSAPAPINANDYRRRDDDNEQLYEVNVTSVHAVHGKSEQRCWVERQQVAPEQSSSNVPAAIAGAVIGSIFGHQLGHGRGMATVGGAVVGAAVGANVGRDNDGPPVPSQDVQRCASVPSQNRPDYWDVTYIFNEQEHRIQMNTPPGASVTVNEWGEPRE